MKFSVNREKLFKALQRVNSIIGSRSMLPILGNMMMKAEEGTLQLTTTDLEIRITTSAEAQVDEPGETTVPARKLAALVSCFTGDTVEFSVTENNHMRIHCGSSNFTLLGLSSVDFPEMVSFEAIRELKIKEADFKRMLSSISYAVSPDDSRKVLTGVLLTTSNNFATLVATDGKRLAMQEKNLEFIDGTDGEAIVPLKAANEVRRLLENDGVLTIKIGEKQCRFEGASFVLTTKLIEGNYPNFRQVIPTNFSRTIEVDTATLLAKIETVSQVLSDSSSYIILSFGENELNLLASSSEIGEGSDQVAIEYTGEPIDVSFNPVFLADPLKICDKEKVTIKINDAFNPVALEGNEGFLYVIMPIRKNKP